MSDNLIIFLVCAGFLLVFGLAIFGMVTAARRQRQQKVDLAQQLGLLPLEPPDAILSQRIFKLYVRHNPAHLRLKNVFTRATPDGQIYLYDLEDRGGEDTTYIASGAVAMLMPGLDLPALVIFPEITGTGLLAKLANKMVNWAVSRDMIQITFPDRPTFESRYATASAEPEKAIKALTPQFLTLLERLPLLSLQAGGELFTLDWAVINPSAPRLSPAEKTRSLIDAAQQIARLLR